MQRSIRTEDVSRYLLIVILLLAGAGKIIFPSSRTAAELPWHLDKLVAVAEIAMALLLLAKKYVLTCTLLGLAAFSGAVGFALLAPVKACGCFGGAVTITPRMHVVLGCMGAALCCTILGLRPPKYRESKIENA